MAASPWWEWQACEAGLRKLVLLLGLLFQPALPGADTAFDQADQRLVKFFCCWVHVILSAWRPDREILPGAVSFGVLLVVGNPAAEGFCLQIHGVDQRLLNQFGQGRDIDPASPPGGDLDPAALVVR